ncbi:histidinol-phosphate transaminase [Flavobacteriaceae bacterium 3-367]
MGTINRRQWLKQSAAASIGMGGLSITGFNAFGAVTKERKRFDPASEAGVTRLLYNENPNGPSDATKKRIAQLIPRSNRYATFHKYDYLALKNLIAEQEGLEPENVMLGHGSFDPLISVATHFGSKKEHLVVPSPSFDVVGSFARKLGADVVPVEVDSAFKIDLPAMREAIKDKTNLVTVCNPNNPTGTVVDTDELKAFCKEVSRRTPVLIDEAYIHYRDAWRQHTMAPLLKDGANVLVTRTFSKIYGMAGLRIGFMLGPKELIKELEAKFTMGFPGNMPNGLSVAAACAALKDKAFVSRSRELNQQARTDFYKALDQLGLPYIPSAANFVYFDVTDFAAYKKLMWSHKILLAGGWPTKKNWARVTMGTQEELDFLLEKMQGKAWL